MKCNNNIIFSIFPKILMRTIQIFFAIICSELIKHAFEVEAIWFICEI